MRTLTILSYNKWEFNSTLSFVENIFNKYSFGEYYFSGASLTFYIPEYDNRNKNEVIYHSNVVIKLLLLLHSFEDFKQEVIGNHAILLTNINLTLKNELRKLRNKDITLFKELNNYNQLLQTITSVNKKKQLLEELKQYDTSIGNRYYKKETFQNSFFNTPSYKINYANVQNINQRNNKLIELNNYNFVNEQLTKKPIQFINSTIKNYKKLQNERSWLYEIDQIYDYIVKLVHTKQEENELVRFIQNQPVFAHVKNYITEQQLKLDREFIIQYIKHATKQERSELIEFFNKIEKAYISEKEHFAEFVNNCSDTIQRDLLHFISESSLYHEFQEKYDAMITLNQLSVKDQIHHILNHSSERSIAQFFTKTKEFMNTYQWIRQDYKLLQSKSIREQINFLLQTKLFDSIEENITKRQLDMKWKECISFIDKWEITASYLDEFYATIRKHLEQSSQKINNLMQHFSNVESIESLYFQKDYQGKFSKLQSTNWLDKNYLEYEGITTDARALLIFLKESTHNQKEELLRFIMENGMFEETKQRYHKQLLNVMNIKNTVSSQENITKQLQSNKKENYGIEYSLIDKRDMVSEELEFYSKYSSKQELNDFIKKIVMQASQVVNHTNHASIEVISDNKVTSNMVRSSMEDISTKYIHIYNQLSRQAMLEHTFLEMMLESNDYKYSKNFYRQESTENELLIYKNEISFDEISNELKYYTTLKTNRLEKKANSIEYSKQKASILHLVYENLHSKEHNTFQLSKENQKAYVRKLISYNFSEIETNIRQEIIPKLYELYRWKKTTDKQTEYSKNLSFIDSILFRTKLMNRKDIIRDIHLSERKENVLSQMINRYDNNQYVNYRQQTTAHQENNNIVDNVLMWKRENRRTDEEINHYSKEIYDIQNKIEVQHKIITELEEKILRSNSPQAINSNQIANDVMKKLQQQLRLEKMRLGYF